MSANIFRLTQLALTDLRSIGRYTQRTWGREQRNIYLTKLDEYFHILAQNPQYGLNCNHIWEGYRKYPCRQHLIYYRQVEDGIEIIRILHNRMDIELHLEDK